MIIAILNWRDIRHPRGGGAEIVTHEYAKGWIKRGHQVRLVSLAYPGSVPEEEIDGVKINRLGLPLWSNFLLIHPLMLCYYWFCLRGKVDLVVDQIHWVPIFTPLFVKERKLAFIHEVANDIWTKQSYNKMFGFLGSLLGKYLLFPYKNTKFLTVSNTSKESLIKNSINSKNITVIHNGIDIPVLRKPTKKFSQPTLIYIGRISWIKNLEDMILAFSKIKMKIPIAKLFIAGRAVDQKYMDKLTKIIRRNKLTEGVRFLGYISNKKKQTLLDKSHLFLHTSLCEGWGLGVIEAAAQGTPAVVYNVSGLSESVVAGKTGIVCDKNTPDEMAKQILSLLSSDKRYADMQKNCLKRAKEFTWDKAAHKSLNLIESI